MSDAGHCPAMHCDRPMSSSVLLENGIGSSDGAHLSSRRKEVISLASLREPAVSLTSIRTTSSPERIGHSITTDTSFQLVSRCSLQVSELNRRCSYRTAIFGADIGSFVRELLDLDFTGCSEGTADTSGRLMHYYRRCSQ